MKERKREIAVLCPNDHCAGSYKRRKACYANPRLGKWHCFRCDGRGPLRDLVDRGILPEHILMDSFDPEPILPEPLVAGRRAIHPEDHEAWGYLRERLGDQVLRCASYFELDEALPGYIVIRFPGEDFWQARTIQGKMYKNKPGIAKPIFRHIVPGRRFLFVCEGVFDALCSGNGVALLGKAVGPSAVARVVAALGECGDDVVPVAALDPSERQKSEALARSISATGLVSRVGILNYDGLDGDLGNLKCDGYNELLPRIELMGHSAAELSPLKKIKGIPHN